MIIETGNYGKVISKNSGVTFSLIGIWQEMQMREMSHLGNDNHKYQRLSSDMLFQTIRGVCEICLFVPLSVLTSQCVMINNALPSQKQ